MDYQQLVCWGDSQTYGARSYGCFPLHLVRVLNDTTRYTWSAINLSSNGHTARDLWFRIPKELNLVRDVYQACILIGANDVGNETPLDLFGEYYHQILNMLEIQGMRSVYCGKIPEIKADGHAFFHRDAIAQISKYNQCIENAVKRSVISQLVEIPEMGDNCFTDPVHFSEKGNIAVAETFATSIRDQ